MSKYRHYFYLALGLLLILIYNEAVLRLATTGDYYFAGTAYRLLFTIPYALVFFLICTLATGQRNKIILPVLLLINAFVFASQLIYFQVFKTFYSVYSAGNASQIIEFWFETFMVVVRNTHWVLMLFVPPVLLLIFRKRLPLVSAASWKLRMLVILLLVVSQVLGLTTVNLGDRGINSAYDVYYQSSYPVAAVHNFGLLTTIRLDLQRAVMGWTPQIDVPVDAFPDTDPQPDPKKYNVLDLDFQELLETETEEEYKELHEYFSLVPATEKNEYTGMFEGYNLVFITAESLASYAVHEDVTPTLYKLVNEGFKFTKFYNPYWGVSTSDGEYVATQGLIPRSGVWSMLMSADNYLPFTMGNQLQKLGYKTMAYHNHDYDFYRRHISHPNLGYEFKAVGMGLDITPAWPESDLEMMEETIHEYIDHQPFHAYYMTVSGHHQYNFLRNDMAIKNQHLVEDLPYSTEAQAYLATQIELDKALEYLLDQLEAKGVADETLIVLSSDHYPYALSPEAMEELSGHPVEQHFEIHRSPLIIYTQGMESETIDKPASSLDIIPTISNLLGLDYDSRLLMGQDIFSDDDPLVMFVDGSFITDKGRYNSWTGEFIPNPGVEVDEGYLERMTMLVRSKFHYSARILETDYYRHILGQ
ncbi:MAG: LTA synthase family protein [Firmicutes bacterium]|nr:LTA synthase family protein [Bacillota bacterium]